MPRALVGLVFALALAAAIVGVDILIFRHHFWERLAANVGIALVLLAFYLRFAQRS